MALCRQAHLGDALIKGWPRIPTVLLGHVGCALLAPLDRSASCTDPKGGRGSRPPPPPEKSSNTGLDPLKITKLQASIQCWAIICMPEKCHLNDVSLVGQCGPLIVVFESSLPSSTKNKKKTFKVGPPLTKHSGS